MIDPEGDTAFVMRTLDALEQRTRTATHNIASQNVPGFKRYTVRFEDLMRQTIRSGGNEAAVRPVVERDTSGPPDANNVVLLEELALLGKTSLMHDALTQRLGGYFTRLNRAIFGR